MTKKSAPTLAELYPELSEEELIEVEVNLRRYLKVVKEIYDHAVANNNTELLTELRRRVRARKKREKQIQKIEELQKSKDKLMELASLV